MVRQGAYHPRRSDRRRQWRQEPQGRYRPQQRPGPKPSRPDAIGMSGGWSPIIHLACHRGAKPVWSDAKAAFLAPEMQEGLTIAGAAAGIGSIEACLADGAAKPPRPCRQLAFPVPPPLSPRKPTRQPCPNRSGASTDRRARAFVDYQNDVHLKDLGLAVSEGYGHVELAKRYTTNGMATDQGKLSNINAIGILAEARKVSAPMSALRLSARSTRLSPSVH